MSLCLYLWLAGRSIRRPYYSKIKRVTPEEMFLALVRTISGNQSQVFSAPNCYTQRNKKAIVVSFTSMSFGENFLGSLSSKEVSHYMERTLSGYRKSHCVKVLVTETKDFALSYYFRKGQLIISFNR